MLCTYIFYVKAIMLLNFKFNSHLYTNILLKDIIPTNNKKVLIMYNCHYNVKKSIVNNIIHTYIIQKYKI